MTAFDVFPDAELVATTILDAVDDLSDVHVGTKLQSSPDFSKGVMQVQRVGGVAKERHRLDRARIQVDTWHDKQTDARRLAAVANAALLAAELSGSFPSADAFVTGVDPEVGLAWLFDSINLKPRYTFSVIMFLHRL